MRRPRWNTNQLKRLGFWIRDGEAAGDFPSYEEVELWYSELGMEVQQRLLTHDWRSILGHREIEVSARVKTIDTLREKLRRDRATPLSSVQDIAGVRFEAEMTLTQQSQVADAIAELYSQESSQAIHDLRNRPHSGYRAVHVWLRLPARVEVQVRTRLQGSWANAYESLADLVGRQIRYESLPHDLDAAEITRQIQNVSTEEIAAFESTKDELVHRRHVTLQSGLFSESDLAMQEGLWEQLRVGERSLIEQFEKLEAAWRTMKIENGGES